MKNISTKTKQIVVFGGTSDIAQSCLHKWCAHEEIKAILVGRDLDRLNIVGVILKLDSLIQNS